MTKHILVIDNLTESFHGDRVRSGLQKSSKLDARAFSLDKRLVITYAYCGVLVDPDYHYTKFLVDKLGTKDRAQQERGNAKLSRFYLPAYVARLKKVADAADYIVAHCHSVGMIRCVNNLVKGKRILFIIHDVIDLMWATSFCGAVARLRRVGGNYTQVLTNSRYSIERLNAIYARANDKYRPRLMRGDDAFDGYIDHFVWSNVVPSERDITHTTKCSAVIGRYETHKYHHKLYANVNPNNTIVHYGVRDERRDPGLKYYKRLVQKANAYKENLSDEALWQAVKSSQSIILPCFHEGFGFTAFEAGIFGVVPIVLTKEVVKGGKHLHATSEYLTRAGVKHYAVDYRNNKAIFDTIDQSLSATPKQRLAMSQKLLTYFSVRAYTDERLDWLERATMDNATD